MRLPSLARGLEFHRLRHKKPVIKPISGFFLFFKRLIKLLKIIKIRVGTALERRVFAMKDRFFTEFKYIYYVIYSVTSFQRLPKSSAPGRIIPFSIA